MPSKKWALGLMSGTSCDGLTLAAVQLSPFRVLAFENYTYSPALQKRLLHAAELRAPQLSMLDMELGKLYAEKTQHFLRKHSLPAAHLIGAGLHGQTIYHGPQDNIPNTLQLGEAAFLAEVLGRPVVSHFRQRDMVLGGQGAPLVPAFDAYLFGKGSPKILLNLGGIANLSVVGKNIRTRGFDCGPANTLMDLACQQFLHRPFDKNGALAAQGKPDIARVEQLLKQKFFRQKPPKSLDKNDFGAKYLEQYFADFNRASVADLLATLNYFTAAAVADALHRFVPHTQQKEIIVSGGGAFNKTLLKHLRQLTKISVCTSEKYQLPLQAKEAAAFAWMAARALQKKSNHCPSATGARKQTILGQITL